MNNTLKSICNLLLFGCFVFINDSIQAQQLMLGVRTGPALTSFQVADDPNNRFSNAKGKINAFYGVAFHFSVDDIIGLDLEAYYMARNSSVSLYDKITDPVTKSITNFSSQGEYRLTGFDLPILLSVYLRPEKKIRPKLYIGPSLNLLTGVMYDSKSEYRKGDTLQTYISNQSVKKDFVSFFPALVVGGGIHFKVNSHLWVTTDLRYNFGLSNLIDTDAKRITQQPNVKSGDLLFIIGISYKLYDY